MMAGILRRRGGAFLRKQDGTDFAGVSGMPEEAEFTGREQE